MFIKTADGNTALRLEHISNIHLTDYCGRGVIIVQLLGQTKTHKIFDGSIDDSKKEYTNLINRLDKVK